MNIKPQKSLMILIGDASRKGIFLSKQEIPDHIYSILYIHETSMLYIGIRKKNFFIQNFQYHIIQVVWVEFSYIILNLFNLLLNHYLFLNLINYHFNQWNQ